MNYKTAFIRRVQSGGAVFVCPRKDRALSQGEEACEECDCITSGPPQSKQPQTDVREYVKNL